MTSSTNDILARAAALIETGDAMGAQELLRNFHRDSNRRTPESLLLLAAAHAAQSELDEASRLTEEAADLLTSDTDAGQLYARAADLIYRHRPGERHARERIVDLLTRAIRRDSSDRNAAYRRKLCSTLLAIERYEDLLEHSIALTSVPDDRSQARLWAASACLFLNKKPQGEPILLAALAEPSALDDRQLYSALTLAVEYGLLEQADRLLGWMRSANRAGNFRREFAAKIARERGDYGAALGILTGDYIDDMDHAPTRQRLLAVRGKCLDAVGDYAEAHGCFVEMNRLAREGWGRKPDERQLEKLERAIPEAMPAHRRGESQPDEYTPTFLVGFPRSGTTLLESILDTNSRVQTLSERDALSPIAREMRSQGLSYPEDLPRLETTTVELLRKKYYEFQSQYVRDTAGQDIVVDKLPLNILHIPMLHTLFPAAKFILALRHPADVCISCFQQDFVLNKEMIHFTDFEGCFRRYRDVFRLFERYRSRLELEVVTVRYEDLTDDLDGVANALFDFLGAEPEEHYKDFHRINRDRLVNTPSRGQITKPLYRSSRDRWLNYAEFVRPLKAIVEDVANDYGYSLYD